ncbi:MAG: putative Zn-dependent hydrolase [uncultured archaeon A07HB70]|nr:MAG: putative Zn-dependent hydrolase [uncultured archaeon A07HB70]
MFRHDGLTVRWLGYATTRASDGETTVYTDPGRYGVLEGTWEPPAPGAAHPSGPPYDARDGDVVLVTHDHHWDPDGVRRVAAADAALVVYDGVDAARAGREPPPEALPYDVVRVGERETTTVRGVTVTTVPAYNDPDGPHVRESGDPVHPRGFGVGVRFVLDGTPVYWTGDSDRVPEQDGLDVSVLLPTICGDVAMDEAGALDLVRALAPDVVCPVHYDTLGLLRADSGAFARDVAKAGVPVVLDEGWA